MNEINELEIKYTVDDYVRSLTFIQSRQFVHKYMFIIIPVIFIFSIIFVIFMSPDGLSETTLTSTIILIVMLLPFFGILLYFEILPKSNYLNGILKDNLNRLHLCRKINIFLLMKVESEDIQIYPQVKRTGMPLSK